MTVNENGFLDNMNGEVEVKIFSKTGHYPTKATDWAAAYDICAHVEGQPIVIEPGETKAVPTGLYVEIPRGWHISIRPRSGMALKNYVSVLNTPGTIDSDYVGMEIKVILHHHGQGESVFTINHGDRIAQMLIEKDYNIKWRSVSSIDEFSKTDRTGGFGSTGKST